MEIATLAMRGGVRVSADRTIIKILLILFGVLILFGLAGAVTYRLMG
jgi:hypothetical protein